MTVLKKIFFAAFACAIVSTVAFAGWKISTNGTWRTRTNHWKISGDGRMNDADSTENGVWITSAAGTHAIWSTDGFGKVEAEWDPSFELYRTLNGYTIEFVRSVSPEQICWSWEWRDADGELLAQGSYLPD
jgi:hypothetical protein